MVSAISHELQSLRPSSGWTRGLDVASTGWSQRAEQTLWLDISHVGESETRQLSHRALCTDLHVDWQCWEQGFPLG